MPLEQPESPLALLQLLLSLPPLALLLALLLPLVEQPVLTLAPEPLLLLSGPASVVLPVSDSSPCPAGCE